MENKTRIPRIIHYTWFSGDELPEDVQKCMATWKKILPDFEIKKWDMQMARSLNIAYVDEALDARKWAFASDVVRAYAVWKYGGVYMDTDIKVVKRFDELLNLPMVFFIENNKVEFAKNDQQSHIDKEGRCLNPNDYIRGMQIQAAMFMGEKNNDVLKAIIDFYRKLHFLKDDGQPDIEIISPYIYAKVLERFGFRYMDKKQLLGDINIFNSDYVSVSEYECKPDTISIHLAAHGWNKRGVWQSMKYKIRLSPLYKVIKPLRDMLLKYCNK